MCRPPDALAPSSNRRWDVTVATHRLLPQGAVDDRLLATALEREGLSVRFAVWNDPAVDWHAGALTVVRSTWDYHLESHAWLQWLCVAGRQTRLLNPPELLRWNTDKRYLQQLQQAGVPCVPTLFADSTSPDLVPDPAWQSLVIKPAIAASARGTRCFSKIEFETAGREYLRQLTSAGTALLQPYMHGVDTKRERSLVFVDDQFSHAFSKPAFSVNANGSTPIRSHRPSNVELAVARNALAAAPSAALYARVDLVPSEEGPQLMELELIEPDLALRLHPDAAAALALGCRKALSKSAEAGAFAQST